MLLAHPNDKTTKILLSSDFRFHLKIVFSPSPRKFVRFLGFRGEAGIELMLETGLEFSVLVKRIAPYSEKNELPGRHPLECI